MSKVTRRDFIKMGAVGAISAGLSHSLLSSAVNAQQKEVVFLGIFSLTGGAADIGRNMDEGMQFALEEWNYKVLGNPIKWVKRDDESKGWHCNPEN